MFLTSEKNVTIFFSSKNVTLNPITINVCTILCILDLILTTLCLSNPRARLWRPKISGYVEDVVQQFDAFDVQRMFRLSWPAVDMLIKVVSSAVQKLQTVHARGKPAVSTEKKVLMFLYYMGSQPSCADVPLRNYTLTPTATDYDIAHRFGVSDSTVFHCVNKVCIILYEDLKSVIIRWPKGEYAERVMEGFREKQGTDGVIGAIDGSHITISCPREDPAE